METSKKVSGKIILCMDREPLGTLKEMPMWVPGSKVKRMGKDLSHTRTETLMKARGGTMKSMVWAHTKVQMQFIPVNGQRIRLKDKEP